MALAALAIATTVTLLSFGKGESDTNQLWTFTGGDPTVANNYIPAATPLDCAGSSNVCQLIAPSNQQPLNPKPDLQALSSAPNQESILLRIQDALVNGANETVSLKN